MTNETIEQQQQEYRESSPSLVGRGMEKLTKPLSAPLGRAIPTKLVHTTLRNIDRFTGSFDFSAPASHANDLEAARDAAKAVENLAKVSNTSSGALAGFGGIFTMSADIPTTLAIAMRNIRETGRAYGYDGAGEDEQIFRFRLLELATVDDPEQRRERIAALEASIAADGALVPMRDATEQPLIDQMVERIARAVALALVRNRLGAAVPVFGSAIGGAVNYAFQGDVSRAARFGYQARRLASETEPAS